MKTIRVVAAVIRDQDRIFATARGYGDYKGGWEFPGGKIESGETPQQALVREIKEELDTEIIVGELIDTIEYDYPAFHLSMDCFWCTIREGSLTLKEAEAAKWLTADTLDTVNWLPADESLIGQIRSGLLRRKCDTEVKMEVYEALTMLRDKAFRDPELRERLLDTRNSNTPLSDFCRLSTQAGIELYEMDLLSAGEDYYAAMRRSTNGGGENSPLLTGEDDYYELFMEELEGMSLRNVPDI